MLLLDLIPSTAWESNLRSRYPEHWDGIRKAVYARAKWTCECCGDKGRQEAHEVWDYSRAPVQKLKRLVSLCHLCHMAQHFGLAQIKGEAEEVALHIMKVNRWTRAQLEQHLQEAFELWGRRNRVQWRTDTSLLDELIRRTSPVSVSAGARLALPSASRMTPGMR